MSFFGIVIIILLIYWFIVRPFTQNKNRRFDRYDPRGGYGSNGGYGPGGGFGRFSGDSYGYGGGNGFGGGGRGFGMMAGGFAAGALLTYLLEQGRINAAQYDAFQLMEQDQLIQQLQEQNILQQQEIDDLMYRNSGDFGGPDQMDYNDGSYNDNSFDDPFDGGNGNDDTWV
ncbi:hypothetical protein LSG31_16320 [Fodinisporobacter ferrooxydans]|uniref:Uncharacterized protein n=1 Tax=Fodinisporobacter ferrooxydans TaxID=2901836 RepID=A0ABY4CGM4_9BACL|nr:hypothetical protein LSG31_16320 [Alicyclobacillaceae bacterium MYW30-H2]